MNPVLRVLRSHIPGCTLRQPLRALPDRHRKRFSFIGDEGKLRMMCNQAIDVVGVRHYVPIDEPESLCVCKRDATLRIEQQACG